VTLRRTEWRAALKPGDPTLEMHIPAGDPLTPDACAASVARAVEFFPRHFPENPAAKAVKCTTWLLDAQFEDWLGPESNIVRFQREFYLYSISGDAWSAFRFVFDLDRDFGARGPGDISGLPRKTRLQRALIDHVADGGRWRSAGGFVLMEDLPWGRQAYRRAAPDESGQQP